MGHWLDFIHTSLFYELTVLLSIATAVGLLGQLLRQPMIVCFIIVGILVSPQVFGILQSYDSIELLAELGVAILLFFVGLKLDLKLIRTFGKVALSTGIGQVLFTSIIGYLICIALGFSSLTAFYIAVALTFSSTIIIVKLLSDKRETDSLHGRIAIGFLIVQDIVVVLAMVIISSFGIATDVAGDSNVLLQVIKIISYALISLLIIGIFIRYFANRLMEFVANSSELLVIFAISWAALFAALGSYLGLSKELGGLLAGVSLASTPYREATVAKLSSLRDFLLLFFFISLGSHLDLSLLHVQILPAVLLSIFVLVGNPLIVIIIMGYMGYRKRTSFMAGLTVAQISEFSLIFMAMGVKVAHVDNEALGLVTLVGLITIALSVYMITYSQYIYSLLEPFLGVFERKNPYTEDALASKNTSHKSYDMIVFGLGRYGGAIAEYLSSENYKVLGIDFNPYAVKNWRARGYDALYGDAIDQDILDMLQIQNVNWVISSIPHHNLGLTHDDPSLVLISNLHKHNYNGKIAITTHSSDDIAKLQSKGVDIVLLPFKDAAARAVERILNFSSASKVDALK